MSKINGSGFNTLVGRITIYAHEHPRATMIRSSPGHVNSSPPRIVTPHPRDEASRGCGRWHDRQHAKRVGVEWLRQERDYSRVHRASCLEDLTTQYQALQRPDTSVPAL
jgi:hypothetical protein